jgi:hypothetical protein
MLQVEKIYNVGEHIAFDFKNKEKAVFHKFGLVTYTTVTDNLNKKSLDEIKRDLELTKWDINKLEKIYLCKNN